MATHDDTRQDRPHEDHPAKPDSPTELKKPSWSYVLRKTLREFMDDECTDIAAALTYYAVLSVFPALIALVSILSLVGQEQVTTTVIGMLEGVVPSATMTELEPVIENLTNPPAPGLAFVIGLLTALWTASNYVNAFGRGMNRMYEVREGRPIWKLRPVMYGLTAVLLVLVAIAALILVLSGTLAETIGDLIGLGPVALTVWNIAKWPVLLVIVIVIIAVLYYFTPNVKQPKFRWISLGAVIAIVIAALAVLGFSIYAARFGSYSATYGALAGIIIFLLLLWITNLALLFGAEFDAELERGRQLQGGIEAEENLQLPPRDTRASDKKAEKAKEDVRRGRQLRERFGSDRREH